MQHPARFVILLTSVALIPWRPLTADDLPALQEVELISTLDSEVQHVRYWAPNHSEKPRPLFVFLHSWSGNYQQDNSRWLTEAVKRDWIYVHPDFRGVNQTPKACGSKFARQDILDAVDWARKTFSVDPSRIYLAGVSGGGHMAMLMAGHHPDRFSAVSAWVGISDLAEWYRFHSPDGKPQRYAQMILKCLGDAPGQSKTVDDDYRDRSPVFHLHQAKGLPVDIAAGVHDGHSGSVPVAHSLQAFNQLAQIYNAPQISEVEMQQLWSDRKLAASTASDLVSAADYPRTVYLRRSAGPSRVTIFEGGHESLPDVACNWLQQHHRTITIATSRRYTGHGSE